MNRAAELGPTQVPWWRDWRGECCAIIASGSSLRKEDVLLLRDRMHVAVIKSNIDLAPWAEMVYGCDVHWWRHRRGLPDYKGLKLSYDRASAFCGIQLLRILSPTCDELLFEEPGLVGSGGNSGFQLLNQVAQFGCTGILLLGFDMQGPHWYGRNNWEYANNPDAMNFRRWAKAFNQNAAKLKAMGIDVVNASSKSAITQFEFATVGQAIERWGL